MNILTIARLTFKEASRRKIALTAGLLGIAFLIFFNLGIQALVSQMSAREWSSASRQFSNLIVLAGFYAVQFMLMVLSALISADSLAGEIASGAIQGLVTKPLHRAEVFMGKWLGFAVLLALYLVLMCGGLLLSGYAQTGFLPPNIPTGILLIYFSSLVVMSLTLAWSSSVSTLATGGAVFGLYGIAFIGGWVEQFGAILDSQVAVNIGIITSLVLPAESLWRRASYEMTNPLTRMFSKFTPFGVLSVPSDAMVAYALLFLAATLAAGIYLFSKRDL